MTLELHPKCRVLVIGFVYAIFLGYLIFEVAEKVTMKRITRSPETSVFIMSAIAFQ